LSTYNINPPTFYGIVALVGSILVIVIILAILVRVFIGYSIQVGGSRFFISSSQGTVEPSYLGFGFKKNIYKNILVTMLVRDIYIMLWGLLLIIPGIIMTFAYRMVSYILAENPGINYYRALEISKSMTAGNKFKIFVLDLSFIFWYMAAGILIIGGYFLNPYIFQTNAELYIKLRDISIENGLVNPEELNLIPVAEN